MFTYEIGMDIYCTDGEAGKLIKVAIDPHTKRVTDLIVEKGLLLKKDRVIPVELVDDVKVDRVYLSISKEEMKNFPEYREAEFVISDPDILDELGYLPHQTAQWTLRYGQALAGHRPVQAIMRQRVHQGVDPDRSVIGRGTRVRNVDETIGYIDHLLVDAESEEITHLIVRRGLLPFRAIIPMSMVKAVGDETVVVPLTRQQLRSLEKFTPRADQDILRELQDMLQAVDAFDLNQLKVSLADGLVRLTGPVANVLGKERAQRIAESVNGVLGVENKVMTDTEVTSRVTAALLTDPRTLLTRIDVHCEHGIVTLSGKVSSEEIKAAAVEIAAAQPGVSQVDDQLTVRRHDS